jgi:hypothetical protein
LRSIDISHSSLWISWGERINRKLTMASRPNAVANGRPRGLGTLGGQAHDTTEISLFK